MPTVYISKYNRFVDNIIGRISRILGKSYDPVRVKLLANDSKRNKSNKQKKNGKRRRNAHTTKRQATPNVMNKMGELPIARSTESESREPAFILISKNGHEKSIIKSTSNMENRTSNKKKTKKNKTKNSKPKASKKTPKARATLFGLSSIKRYGDVAVNMMKDVTTVKTNFALGPLMLRVEREVGRGAKKELKSATATTAEMYGRLHLRVLHGGAATLHSIKVLQPKQVRVESADDHEKTKEFLWSRSSHIASVVSQKLLSAARAMLKHPSPT